MIATIRSHSSLNRCTVGTSIGEANIGMLYSVTSTGVWSPISLKYAYTAAGLSL